MENRDFVKEFQKLEERVKEEQIKREVAYSKMNEAVKAIKEEYEKLQGLDIPIINGEPIVNVNLNLESLNNPVYVAETVNSLRNQLQRIDTIGLQMIDNALAR